MGVWHTGRDHSRWPERRHKHNSGRKHPKNSGAATAGEVKGMRWDLISYKIRDVGHRALKVRIII